MKSFLPRPLLTRGAQGLALLCLLVLGTFVLTEWAPGDFLSEMRFEGSLSAETEEALRQRYGLDDPWPKRFGRWLLSLARGEMGWSFSHNMPVGPLLWPRAINTLILAVSAMALAWGLALPLGMAMARWRGGWVDRLGLGGSALPMAVPEVLLALAALLLAVRSGWFPTGGTQSLDYDSLGGSARLLDRLHHLCLPTLVLAAGSFPALLRHVRSAARSALGSPFVVVARGHGVGEGRLLLAYVLPAAANPLISLFGLSLGRLLSGSLVVEVVLSWPGVGTLLLDAVMARDLHVVLAVVLLSGMALVMGNLLADLGLFLLDPRLRHADRPGGATA